MAAIFLGVTFLPMGIIGAQRVFAGVIFLVVGIGVFMVSARLARGEPMARFIATALMAVYALLGLVGGGRDTATLLEFGLAAGIVCLLWLPQDARAFFAQPPAQVQSPFAAPGNNSPGYEAPGYEAPGNGAQGYGAQGYGAQGYGDSANSGQPYAGQSYGSQPYEGPGNEAPSYGSPGNEAPSYGSSGSSGAGYAQPGSGNGFGGPGNYPGA